jgi:hypothetical protein
MADTERIGDMSQTQPEMPTPHAALNALDPMLGRWSLEGRVHDSDATIAGQLRLERLDGDFYVVQHVDLDYGSHRVVGAEYIGWDTASEQLKSMFFSNQGPGPFGGFTLEYVWEVAADGITVWGGYIGSPANFRARFEEDGAAIRGTWLWPGGGYDAVLRRLAA